MINAIFPRDFPVVQGVTLFVRRHGGAGQHGHRHVYALLDPRVEVRHGEAVR